MGSERTFALNKQPIEKGYAVADSVPFSGRDNFKARIGHLSIVYYLNMVNHCLHYMSAQHLDEKFCSYFTNHYTLKIFKTFEFYTWN